MMATVYLAMSIGSGPLVLCLLKFEQAILALQVKATYAAEELSKLLVGQVMRRLQAKEEGGSLHPT